MSQIYFIISNFLTIAVIITYFRQVIKGTSIPNPSTWLLWALIGIMNAASYFWVVRGDLWQSFYTLVMAIGLTTIFMYSLINGKFAKFGIVETICSLLAAFVGVLWKTTGNADLANIFLQVIFLVSVVPTIYGLWKGRLREKGLPWNLAVSSHAFAALGILASDSFRWIALIYPLVTGVLGNGSVALIVFLQTHGVLHKKTRYPL